mgnify:CR=1 FL=1
MALPEGMTDLGKGTFAHSSLGGQLKSVKLSSTITTMGSNVFQRCVDLEIDFNDSLQVISDWAFLESGISHIELPNSVTTLGIGCF